MHSPNLPQSSASPSPNEVTQLLAELRDGDASASTRLYSLLYPEIKRLARSRLYAAGGVTSLNTTISFSMRPAPRHQSDKSRPIFFGPTRQLALRATKAATWRDCMFISTATRKLKLSLNTVPSMRGREAMRAITHQNVKVIVSR